MSKKTSRFAWDGIDLELPALWEVRAIEQRGRGTVASFADDGGKIRLLLRWEDGVGRPRPEKALGAIGKAARRTSGGPEGFEFSRDVPLPAMKRLKKMGAAVSFRWKGKDLQGAGAVVFCGKCSRATALEVLQPGSAPLGEGDVECVLGTFRDHAEGDSRPWCAWGLSARLPARFSYAGHGYDPRGLARFTVKSGRETVTVCRWSRASAHLKGSGLEGFFKKVFKKERRRQAFSIEHGTFEGHPALTFEKGRPGLMERARSLLGRDVGRAGLIWHCVPENRLYAVVLGAKGARADMGEALDLARGVRCTVPLSPRGRGPG